MHQTPRLKPFERRRAFEEILLQLEAAIDAGDIEAGSRLPSERELAESLGVSRTSVREAMRVLEGLGLVRVRPGSENGAALLEEPTNALPRLFGLHFALRHVSLPSLIEFRALVESWAAGKVTEEAPAETVAGLDAMLDEMEAADQARFHELDADFHLAIVRGAGNELATLVLEGVRGAVSKVMLAAIAAAGDWPETQRRLVDEHRAIVEAIRADRPEAATQLAGAHVRGFYEQHLRS